MRYIETARNQYIKTLTLNGDTERAMEIANKNMYEPIYDVRELHPESTPYLKDYNESLVECLRDIAIIGAELQTSALEYKTLAESVVSRLNTVKRALEAEQQLQEDIALLCSSFTSFDNVISIDNYIKEGDYSYLNSIYGAKITSQKQVSLEVLSVEGNGYEGNNYVIKDGKFLKDTMDTSTQKNITDNNTLTIFEYSRITANSNEIDVFPLVNFDNVNVRCTITLKASKPCNKIKIKSTQNELRILDVMVSSDNINYTSTVKEPFLLNDIKKTYDLTQYINGSGLICFPTSTYFKVFIDSPIITDDAIGFYKTELVATTSASTTSTTATTTVNSVSGSEPEWYQKYSNRTYDNKIDSSTYTTSSQSK